MGTDYWEKLKLVVFPKDVMEASFYFQCNRHLFHHTGLAGALDSPLQPVCKPPLQNIHQGFSRLKSVHLINDKPWFPSVRWAGESTASGGWPSPRPNWVAEVICHITNRRIDSKAEAAVAGSKNGRLCLAESAAIIWMASRRRSRWQEERPRSSALKKTSSWPLQMLAWVPVCLCRFGSWEAEVNVHQSLADALCPTSTQDDPPSPSSLSSEEDMDSCSADDDLKDQAENSDSESGNSSDNHGDWAPLYRPHLSSHGNHLSLKAQQLSDTGRAGPQDGGNKTGETWRETW